MTAIEIVNEGLKSGGFGGLYVPGTCGCLVDELSPDNCLSGECCAGYKHTHSQSGEWVVAKHKDQLSDDEIENIANNC